MERPGRGQNAKRSAVVGFRYTAAVTKLQTTSRDRFPPTRLVFLLCRHADQVSPPRKRNETICAVRYTVTVGCPTWSRTVADQ